MKKAIAYNDNFYSFDEDKIYTIQNEKHFTLDLKFKKKITIFSGTLPRKYDYLPFEIKIAKHAITLRQFGGFLTIKKGQPSGWLLLFNET